MDGSRIPAVVVKADEVYSPWRQSGGSVVSIGDRIAFVGTDSQLQADGLSSLLESSAFAIEVLDGKDCIVVPGFIDGHVHLIGGGGEGGPHTRTPEVMLSTLTTAGVTTVVGVLGTDGITRSVEALLAKARALELEGISTYIYTGAYELPTRTITGGVRSDLVLIDKVIGVGEIAIADHRSAQAGNAELARVAAEARVGGMLGGKPGVVHLHVGRGSRQLSQVLEVIETTDLPPTQFYPTHVNRTEGLFEQALELRRLGGTIDLTAGISPNSGEGDSVAAPKAFAHLLETEGDLERITLTSDGNGSMPTFDDKGNLVSLEVGPVDLVFQEVREAVLGEGLPPDKVLKVVTENPARLLNLFPRKGAVLSGSDADFVVLTREDWQIRHVVAKGRVLVRDGVPVVKGTFEV